MSKERVGMGREGETIPSRLHTRAETKAGFNPRT